MNSIRNRLWLLFLVNFIITAALSITIIYSYEKNNEISSTLLLRNSQIQKHALQTELFFKTQVQEWKNTLLRGHEPKQYKKYYQQFKQAEKDTKNEVQLLIGLIEDYPKLQSGASNFLFQHEEMGYKYEQALTAYNSTKQNAHITADQQVRGIDREPIKSLAQIITDSAELILSERNTAKEKHTQLKITLGIITALFLATLTAGFIFVLRKGIQSPLNDLASHVQSLVEGNKDLTLRLENSSVAELQELTVWFNSFVNNIQTLMLQINEAASNLSSASSSSAVINDQTNNAIKTQQAAIDQVAVAMEQMTQTVQQVADNAQQTAGSANTAIHDANTGRKIVLEVIDEINQLTSEVSVTSEAVQHMSEESERIHSILSVITEITDQTNLLALNAAIEAARAGEHGRGFAVVADEVRGLANKTLQATGQITGMIESMQLGVKNSLKAINSSRSQADKTAAMAQNAKSAIEKITSSVEIINDMNQSVASASRQQSQTAHDINSNILNISTSINATVNGAQQDTSNSSDLAQLSMMLSSLINQFKVSEHQQQVPSTVVESNSSTLF